MYDALIVVNGEIPPPAIWRDLPHRTLICTDGAANLLQQFTITPDIIIGDMDSIAVDTQFAMVNSLQIQFPDTKIHQNDDQYTTDFEKALIFAQQNAIKKLLCVGALGLAADHAIYNLGLIARYQTNLNLMLLHYFNEQRQWVFPLQKNTCIATEQGAILSLFPYPSAVLTTEGLRWELNADEISQLGKGAIRNRVVSEKVNIKTEGTCLCFVTCEAPPIISTF